MSHWAMLSNDPTYLGTVASVSGAALTVHLAPSVASGISIIKGHTYRVAQVGSFVRVPQGYQDLFGVVSGVGAAAVADHEQSVDDTGRWMQVELVGETVGGIFERGVSQYPNIGDIVHIAVEDHLRKIYDIRGHGHVAIGTLSSAESISAKISLNELVTRHSAVLGSTGSGKSTTIASLLRAITASPVPEVQYPSARVLMLDIHGEYAEPLADVAQVYSVEPQYGEERLYIPYWALETRDLLGFLAGGLEGNRETVFTDKIFDLKLQSHAAFTFPGVDPTSITVDSPLPFSLKKLWYDLIDFEIMTFEGKSRDQPTRQEPGDAETLAPPVYKPHAMGAAGPFLNQQAYGIQRPLNLLRSRLLDRRYDFMLHPGPWEPGLDGKIVKDLDELLAGWLGGTKPITILDLSGVPSGGPRTASGFNTESCIRSPVLESRENGRRYPATSVDCHGGGTSLPLRWFRCHSFRGGTEDREGGPQVRCRSDGRESAAVRGERDCTFAVWNFFCSTTLQSGGSSPRSRHASGWPSKST